MGFFGGANKAKLYKNLAEKTDGLIWHSSNQNLLSFMLQRVGGKWQWVTIPFDDMQTEFKHDMTNLVKAYIEKFDSSHISTGDEITINNKNYYVKQCEEDREIIGKIENGTTTNIELMRLQIKCVEFTAFFDSLNRGKIFCKPKANKIIGSGTQHQLDQVEMAQVNGYEGLGLYMWMLTVDDSECMSTLESRVCFSVGNNSENSNDQIWVEIRIPDIQSIHTIGANLVHQKLKLTNLDL